MTNSSLPRRGGKRITVLPRPMHLLVSSRYPGVSEEVSEEEYRRAIELAERVVEWAEAIIYSFVSDEPKPLSGVTGASVGRCSLRETSLNQEGS